MTGPLNNKQEQILQEAVHKFVDAQSRGVTPDIDEFVKQYPKLGPQIRQRILNLRKIDTLFDALVQADERDFDGVVPGQDLVGQTIGGFEVVEMIGRGGMGVVYLARDTKLDRSVAIKSLPADQAGDSQSRTRFRREATLLASLNHSNIATIHEIIEQDDGSAYLILEHIPGETLARRMAREPLELEQALAFGQQIAEAVAAAHEKDVIHRDLKPGNIKITPEGKAKVLDFGLAKAAVDKDSEKDITVTQPGRVIGTPAYMSPEQARAKPTSHCTDIWSFGCIMYEMLVGQRPFEGETATDTLAQIIEHEPNWQALPKSTPSNIRVLLRRCLEKNPGQRLQHMADAVLEIHEAVNLPAMVSAITVPVKSQRVKIVIGVIVMASLCAVATWLTCNRRTNRTNNDEARMYYKRGNDFELHGFDDRDNVLGAIKMHGMAVESDPNFAEAHAKLSKAHSGMCWFDHDSSNDHRGKARKALEIAIGLDPELPETLWAQGFYHYWCLDEYDIALELFKRAQRAKPHDSQFIAATAYAQRRVGKFPEALANLKKAYEADRLSRTITASLGQTSMIMRQYADAEKYLTMSIDFSSGFSMPYLQKAKLYLRWKGNTEDARAVLSEALRKVAPERQKEIHGLLVDIDIYHGDYQGALKRLNSIVGDSNNVGTANALQYARIYQCMEDKQSGETHYKSAEDSTLKTIEETASEERKLLSILRSHLGIARAGLGKRDDAIGAGMRAVELMQDTKNTWEELRRKEDLARIYTMLGDLDAAMDIIKVLVQNPGELSVPMLEIDPDWKPLRDHPRYEKLVTDG